MLALILAALAAPRVDPGLERSDVPDAYFGWAESQGRPAAARDLVCRPFAEGTVLCFSRIEADRRVLYTRADGQTLGALESAARGSAKEAVSRLDPVKIDGFSTPYWVAAVGDGRDHAAVLHPEALRSKLGDTFVVATPARGVLVAWTPGDVVFDKIVAVGIRKMYETLPDPVTPLIYRWSSEKGWATWGAAREVVDSVGPTPIPAAATPNR